MIDPTRVTRLMSAAQIRSVVQATARINVWSGAIRSGKTIASLLRWMMYVATAPSSGRLVMVGRTRDTIARNLFSPLQDPAIFGDLAAHVHYTAGATTAHILGREVDVIGANDVRAETRLRGLTCAGAYVDEATLIPAQFWTQLLGRMSVDGAKMFATTNPDNPAHWLRRDFILRAGALNLRHWHFTLHDNPHLSDEYKAAISAEFVGLWYRRFVLGHWIAAEGAIYDMWDERRHVVAQVPQIQRWLSLGVDYGQTNPFAAVLLGLGVDDRMYAVAEWRYDARQQHRSLTDPEYSERVRAWLDTMPIPGTDPVIEGVRPEYVAVDPSAKSFRVQLSRDGLTPVQARNDVLDGIRNVSALLARDRLRVHRSCDGILAEVGGYAWDDEKAQKGLDVPIKADDHSLDALRYGVHTTEALWRPALLDAA